MTEYTTSSEAIREFFTSRDRTLDWVNRHFHHGPEDGFMSPSSPPSELDDSDAPSYGPSDSDDESTHSLPPRMVLRWNDGRPDIPIAPDPRNSQTAPRSRQTSRRSMSREPALHPPTAGPPFSQHTISHNPSATATAVPLQRPRWEQTLSYVTAPLQGPPDGGQITPPRSPEHIVILPSPQEESVPQAPVTRASSHVAPPGAHLQSSLSRTPTQSMHPVHPISPSEPISSEQYESPQHQPEIIAPSPRRPYDPSHLSRTTQSPPITQSYSQPLPAPHGSARLYDNPSGARVPSQLPYAYSPPAIVYAPSSRHGGSRYAPPAIVYSPPSHQHQTHARGPAPSITYSHSAPLPHGHNQYYAHGAGPQYGSLRGAPSHLSSTAVEEEPEDYARSRSRSHKRSVSRSHRREGSEAGRSRGRSPGGVITVPRSPAHPQSHSPSLDEGGSETSGSTYYILPTPGQKVQIIQTGPPSLYTATSTTKSGHHSPHSPHSSSSSKKPFFQRIFSIPSIPKLASSVNSRGSSGSTPRKLQRRPTVTTHAQQA